MRMFFTRVGVIVALLSVLLVFDALILGTLSVWGALALLPLCGMASVRLLRRSLRSTHKRRRRPLPVPPGGRPVAAPRHAPLRVAPCKSTSKGSHAA